MPSYRPRRFSQRDVTRAFKATGAAGITARVDILPDGTLSITQLPQQEAVEAPAPGPDATPAAAGLRSWD